MSKIIYAPQGSGKTRTGEALREHFGLQRIIDDWCPGDPLPDDALVLTNEPCAISIPLAEALASMRP